MNSIYKEMERNYLNLCRYIDEDKCDNLDELKAISYSIHVNLLHLRSILD